MTYRPLCTKCLKKPAAYNYRKGTKVYYRKLCNSCIGKSQGKARKQTAWESAGYKKKPQCEACGFRAKFQQQLTVWFVDRNLNNTNWRNLKTVCLNCQIELTALGIGWKQGGLTPDL
jgi:hypothetical protein